MRKMAWLIMAVFMVALHVPVFAADTGQQQKNECLLASKNCMNQADTIQQKMKKLNAEIKKGNRVYSQEELKKLQDKLAEAEKTLDTLLRND